jgi:hypothetical protein
VGLSTLSDSFWNAGTVLGSLLTGYNFAPSLDAQLGNWAGGVKLGGIGVGTLDWRGTGLASIKPEVVGPIAATSFSGFDGGLPLSLGLDDRSLLNRVEAAARVRRMTINVSEPRLLDLEPQYRTEGNAVVYGSAGSTRAFGDITASRYVLSDVPMFPSIYGPMVAAWDQIGTGFIGVPIADGRYHFMEAPEGYNVPSRALTQALDLAAGTWDALKALPGAVADAALAVPDGYRLLANQLFGNGERIETWSHLARESQAGRITVQSLYQGVIDASPVGAFGHMLDGDYRAAGQSVVGIGVGLASGPALSRATSFLNRLPVLGHELPVARLLTQSALSMQRSVMWVGAQLNIAAGRFMAATGDGLATLKNIWAQGMENLAAPRTLNSQFGGLLIDLPDALVQTESAALRRIGQNNQAGSPWADLRRAYQQAQGQVDFAHIEADVKFKTNGQVKAKGGHFYNSPMIDIVPGTETVGANRVVRAQINILGPDGNWYPKNNSAGGISSLTPSDWSLAQAKGEMSQAWVNRTLDSLNRWQGISGGVTFRFNPPIGNVTQWRGFPLQIP